MKMKTTRKATQAELEHFAFLKHNAEIARMEQEWQQLGNGESPPAEAYEAIYASLEHFCIE
jgi:hypothetical protein